MDSEPEPDISVVRGTRAEVQSKHPTTALLVVEIAVTSVAMDREYASLYAEADIPEFWIVLAEAKQVEVRRQPANGSYSEQQTYGQGETPIYSGVPGSEHHAGRTLWVGSQAAVVTGSARVRPA